MFFLKKVGERIIKKVRNGRPEDDEGPEKFPSAWSTRPIFDGLEIELMYTFVQRIGLHGNFWMMTKTINQTLNSLMVFFLSFRNETYLFTPPKVRSPLPKSSKPCQPLQMVSLLRGTSPDIRHFSLRPLDSNLRIVPRVPPSSWMVEIRTLIAKIPLWSRLISIGIHGQSSV